MSHIHISLLPTEYKKQKQLRRKFGIYTIVMCTFISVLIFTYIIVQILSTIPKSQLMVINNEIEIYNSEINSLKEYSDFRNNLKKMETLVMNAASDQPHWLELFIAISESAPEGLQITEISTDSDQERFFTIRGNAENHEMPAVWVQNLKQSKEFSDANLKFSHTTAKGTVEYEIKVIPDKDILFKLLQEVEK
ncbi:MAG: PilN domain-containing protein [Clostridiaceae bacterium]|nr:PilN domain-containing protein [Clostridiaceae bacterium]